MPSLEPERAAVVQQVTALAQVLYEALDRHDVPQIQSAQQNLTAVAELIWSHVDQDAGIAGRDKAMVRLLAGAAIKDLPMAIQSPANYPKIQRDLRMLRSSLMVLK